MWFIIYFQLEELKERASGNLDESFLSPGISERQPLHVMMVRVHLSICYDLVMNICASNTLFSPSCDQVF